ncbi:MAG: hypothetical protein V7K98_21460 [Nostoc sp.]|uniref:hypothetical protein n=1 Tax=Nostoc sp. TaxID=1180 RepID=UPI002FF7D824
MPTYLAKAEINQNASSITDQLFVIIPNSQCPMPNAQFPMPNAQFPIPNVGNIAWHENSVAFPK